MGEVIVINAFHGIRNRAFTQVATERKPNNPGQIDLENLQRSANRKGKRGAFYTNPGTQMRLWPLSILRIRRTLSFVSWAGSGQCFTRSKQPARATAGRRQ